MNKDLDALKSKYDINDLGDAKLVLGMRITRDRSKRTLVLDQQVYIQNILKRTGMEQCGSVDTPVELGKKLCDTGYCGGKPSDDGSRDFDTETYGSVVGSLQYAATSTRPDIAYAVNCVARYVQKPKVAHWNACKRVLRYLRGTSNLGLRFTGTTGNANFTCESVFSDADWGSDPTDRRSVTGYAVKMSHCAVSWVSKKQTTVALSSAEAEYMAISAATQEAKWIRQVLAELHHGMSSGIKLFSDNQSAIDIAKNDTQHSRTKHIDIRHHFIRDSVQAGEIDISWIPSEEQQADIFTKALPAVSYIRLRDQLMGRNQ